MFSFYIIFNAHLLKQNIFNTKLQVVYLLLKHCDYKQRNLHKYFIRLYLVLLIGFASKCKITIVRRMLNKPLTACFK